MMNSISNYSKIFVVILALAPLGLFAQTPEKPKLVVGVVVDQMRPEYLYRFYHQFGKNGFKRLMRDGFSCNNTHINYVPTVTGSGHASIYTGTTPKYHGIVENYWYNRDTKKVMYCSIDHLSRTVGNDSEGSYSYSSLNLLATTITDELKLSTNKKGKIIAISLKDRGATFPAGHMPDGAYWFDQKTGNFVTSTFYMPVLPEWVKAFNNKKLAGFYNNKVWDLLLPENSYTMSVADDNPWEITYIPNRKPIFPYDLKELSQKKKPEYYVLYASAFGNTLLTDFVLDAINNNNLGTDEYPDILAISYSSPDAAGHKFGPLSKELNDIYVRLDLEIARLLEALDSKVGKGNYVLFLTADHAVGDNPKYLTDNKIPGGSVNSNQLNDSLKLAINKKYGEGNWVESVVSNNIYLNHALISEKGINIKEMQDYAAWFLRNLNGVAEVFTATQLIDQEYSEGIDAKVQKGFNYKRNGDIIYVLMSGWMTIWEASADHGSPYTCDTNIPLLWYGKSIPKGESYKPYNITDIAPTISAILKIKYPSACIGNPITEIFQK